MKIRADSLLRDLVTLLRRYSLQDWAALADILDDDETRSQIVLFLRGLSSYKEISRVPSWPKSNSPADRAQSSLTRKGESRGEHSDMKFSDMATAELRELARRKGLRVSPKDSRRRLLRKLVSAPFKDTSKPARPSKKVERDPGDYVQWADIIMGASRRKH